MMFRMLVHRGYVKAIPKGQVLVFAIAMAGYMNLLSFVYYYLYVVVVILFYMLFILSRYFYMFSCALLLPW